MTIYGDEPTNICRRFIHPKLVKFVNSIIPFGKYNLPCIQPYREMTAEELIKNPDPLKIFSGKTIYAN